MRAASSGEPPGRHTRVISARRGNRRRVAQREQELQALREELQARQSHFTELTRCKELLQSELRQVEEEIAALAATATTERPAPTVPTAALARPRSLLQRTSQQEKTTQAVSLPKLPLRCVGGRRDPYELRGRDTEPTPEAWRRLLKLPADSPRKTATPRWGEPALLGYRGASNALHSHLGRARL
jgi:hypothetical protein